LKTTKRRLFDQPAALSKGTTARAARYSVNQNPLRRKSERLAKGENMKTPKTITALMGIDWYKNYIDSQYDEPYRAERYDENHYCNNLRHIREAIIAKAIGLAKKLPEPTTYFDRYDRDKLKYKYVEFEPHLNGDCNFYSMPEVFDALPVLTGDDLAKLTANAKNEKRFYTAMWGYDQTNITTAEHIGTFNGLDVIIVGGFSARDIHIVKMKDNTGGYKGGKKFTIDSANFYGEPMTAKEANHEYNTKDSWAAHGWAR
jgi:hypothetical protein